MRTTADKKTKMGSAGGSIKSRFRKNELIPAKPIAMVSANKVARTKIARQFYLRIGLSFARVPLRPLSFLFDNVPLVAAKIAGPLLSSVSFSMKILQLNALLFSSWDEGNQSVPRS